VTNLGTRRDRRLGVLFHESEILGAGVSILRALEALRPYAWTSSGWFPGAGPLVAESEAVLAARAHAEKPIAVSLHGWRREPGILGRLTRTPAYVRHLKRWLSETKPDVVHANSLLMLPEATVARALGLPVVLQVHELPAAGRKRDLTLRWAGRVAEVLIAVSDPVHRMLAGRAGRTPVVTIHNGVPLAARSRHAERPFVVGTIGHVARTKGTDVFLEAAALVLGSHPDIRFEHVGPARLWGDEEFDALVESMAASAPLRDAVQMLRRRPAEWGLSRWSLFVLPSRQEAFPLGTLEAMAAGLPVIATEVGGVPEQIVHLESGVLVRADDASALAEWIVRLHDDEALRRRLAITGRRCVRTCFTLEAQARALDEAYRMALERHGRLC
jgi:glycosyltransferase involved in cell wall biosynthesis